MYVSRTSKTRNTKGIADNAFANLLPKPPIANTKGVAPVSPALANAYAANNPGWTPPASTGLVATPGAPGKPASAPVEPYMTGPDIINFGDAYKSKGDQLAQSDKDLGDVKAWAQTAIYNIGRNYLQGTDNAQNDAAGRGIFQSSIKDGALADLAATKATMSSDVNTRVNNAQLFHDAAVKRINDWFDNFTEGMNSIKVSNASAAGPGDPGTPAGPTTYSLPAPAQTPPAGPSLPGKKTKGITDNAFADVLTQSQADAGGYLTNPATGKRYKIVTVGGATYHVYADGHRVKVA